MSAVPAPNTDQALGLWDQTKTFACECGTWAYDGGTVAVAWLKEAFLWLGERVVDVWGALKNAFSEVFRFLCDLAVKGYELALPYLSRFGQFVQHTASDAYTFGCNVYKTNPDAVKAGGVCLVVGLVLGVIINRVLG